MMYHPVASASLKTRIMSRAVWMRKGRATDQVCMGDFWISIKYEQICLPSCSCNMELFLGITPYVDFYNNQRKYQNLDYQILASVYMGVKKGDSIENDNSSKKKKLTFEKTT